MAWRTTEPAPGVLRLALGKADHISALTGLVGKGGRERSRVMRHGTAHRLAGTLSLRFDSLGQRFSLSSGGHEVLAMTQAVKPWRERRPVYLGETFKKSFSPFEGRRLTARGADDIQWFGLGEKVGALGRNERTWVFSNSNRFAYGPSTDPLAKSIPFLLGAFKGEKGTEYFGLHVELPGKGHVDLRGTKSGNFEIRNCDDFLLIHIFGGPGPGQVLEKFTALAGRAPMPPLWSLGYHHSRMDIASDAQARDFAKKFRQHRLPIDSIHLDLLYMDGFKLFTFEPKKFAAPKALFKDLAEQGIQPVLILNPGVKKDEAYGVYATGKQQGAFVRTAQGADFEGGLWPGTCVFPDFFKPSAIRWWKRHVQGLLAQGVKGIWLDMNEPSLLTSNDALNGGFHETKAGVVAHERIHNLYGNAMTAATAAAFKDKKEQFILARGAYTGIQSNAAVWIGDNCSSFEHLSMSIATILSLGLSGVGFAGGDLGGFVNNAYPELLARWYQFGAVTPFFRNHSMEQTRSQEPWNYPKATLDICRKYMELRYELLPYFIELFQAQARCGLPVIRPMLLEFPKEAVALGLSDQFMLGPDLLVAPVVKAGAQVRDLWLPPGEWFDYWGGAKLLGGRFVVVDAPLDKMPLYVRGGAILPRWHPGASSSAIDKRSLRLDVFVGKGDSSKTVEMDPGYLGGKGRLQSIQVSYDRALDLVSIRPVGPAFVKKIHLTMHGASATKVIVRQKGPRLVSCSIERP